MSDYNSLLTQIKDESNTNESSQTTNIKEQPPIDKLFTVDSFVKHLAHNSHTKNKHYSTRQQRISGYDIASGCIKQVIYRLKKVPLQNYTDTWLPVMMRSTLGSGVHDFIQDNYPFTELEKSMKVNSINFSGRFDGCIGNHTIAEIKSLPYLGPKGYETVIKTQCARTADFYQNITYKYILENHLEEIKQHPRTDLRTDPPAADKYDIKHIQFIYVAHDIFASDVDSIHEANAAITKFKRQLKTAKNKFAFITCITYDLTKINIDPYMTYVKEKIEDINNHLESNKTPTMDNKFINKESCFFCKYKRQCKVDGG